jgi:hypothetical protein
MAETKEQAMARVLEDIKTHPTCLLSDAAIALGISRTGAYNAAEKGEIETIRIGRRWVAITAPLRQKLKIDAA